MFLLVNFQSVLKNLAFTDFSCMCACIDRYAHALCVCVCVCVCVCRGQYVCVRVCTFVCVRERKRLSAVQLTECLLCL